MARVPEEEIERLKKEISLERLAEARGVKLVGQGENLVGLCPFHEDREPSLVISPTKNLWHCLGACQAGGSPIDWVMKAEGASFRHAVELLRGGAMLERSTRETASAPKHGLRRKLAPLASPEAGDAELMSKVVQIYQSTLRESPEALGYLESRGLGGAEIVEHFGLGYANRTLGYRLPQGRTKTGAELRRRLAELGVYRETGHEHLAGSLVVPLHNEAGEVVQLYGRKVRDDLRDGTPKHLYLPGGHRGVFHRKGLVESDEAILCEAVLDAMTFWAAGYRNVTSAYGVEGCTDELIDALVAAEIAVVRIAFDRDEAGDRAAVKVSERLKKVGIETLRVLFPKGMDANAYALKVKPAEQSLGLVLRQAEWMSRGAKTTVEILASVARDADVESARLSQAEGATERPHEIEGRLSGRSIAPQRVHSEGVFSGEATTPATEARAERAVSSSPLPYLAASSSGAPSSAATAESDGEEQVFRVGGRKWRVRSLSKEGAAGELKVHVFLASEGGGRAGFFVDTVDLYSARQRGAFLKAAAAELEVDERVLGKELGPILLAVEAKRESKRAEAAAPKKGPKPMSDEERAEALELLRDPKLATRIVEDLERVGIVGEETNKLIAYLAATSRKLEEPLAVVIQSSSAAGKSSLMDAVLSLIPEEERVQYSAMTGQSLFYMGGEDLRHKVLAIVEEEGAEKASYALKLLQSEGELTIASTGKDAATGKLMTHTYRVEGPVMIFLTTTAIEVDEELLNRCVVLAVDEGRAQTRAIHARQRRGQTLEGLLEREDRQHLRRLHRNAQRLLRPLLVVNPHAQGLQFADHVTRTRRDHMKYLTMIRAVALLHQHQREVKRAEHRGRVIEYIEATEEDVALGTRLGESVLGRGLDELPPQTRRLLELVHAMVKERATREGVGPLEVRITRREVREWTRWGQTQLKVHFRRLEELEYVLVRRTHGMGRGGATEYELAYADDDGRAEGIETDAYDPNWAGPASKWAGGGRGEVGPWAGARRGAEKSETPSKEGARGRMDLNGAKAHPGLRVGSVGSEV